MHASFISTLALAGLAAAQINNGTSTGKPVAVVTTAVVTAFTTYCPAATVINYNGQAYTATGPGNVVITNCPCAVTRAANGTTVLVTPAAGNGTKPAATVVPYKGAGNKAVMAGSGLAVGFAGLAFLL